MMAVACAGSGAKGMPLLRKKDHHGVERDALVAVDKGMVAGEAKRIGCRKRSQIGLSVCHWLTGRKTADSRRP